MEPALLIFATRYDDVTRRTHNIARRLMASAGQRGIATLTLLDDAATGTAILGAVAHPPAVIAFYSHGDLQGAILAQDGEPCWTAQTVPDLSGTAIFAHACRAIRWLGDQAADHKARLLVGYAADLITPADGSGRFWERYEQVHSLVPQELAAGADEASIQKAFYDFCTTCFHVLNTTEAGLIELMAIQQSRDEIVFA
jgi:hypothetical protein